MKIKGDKIKSLLCRHIGIRTIVHDIDRNRYNVH